MRPPPAIVGHFVACSGLFWPHLTCLGQTRQTHCRPESVSCFCVGCCLTISQGCNKLFLKRGMTGVMSSLLLLFVLLCFAYLVGFASRQNLMFRQTIGGMLPDTQAANDCVDCTTL